RMPSVNSTANSASSDSVATSGSAAVSEITPSTPSPSTNPATRNSAAVDRIVRWARLDSSTASRSRAANAVRSMGGTDLRSVTRNWTSADQTSRHTATYGNSTVLADVQPPSGE